MNAQLALVFVAVAMVAGVGCGLEPVQREYRGDWFIRVADCNDCREGDYWPAPRMELKENETIFIFGDGWWTARAQGCDGDCVCIEESTSPVGRIHWVELCENNLGQLRGEASMTTDDDRDVVWELTYVHP